MILHVLRALFILLMVALGYYFIQQDPRDFGQMDVYVWLTPALAVSVAVLLVCVDILAPRKKLGIFAGTFFGLIVGLILAYALSFVVSLLFSMYGTSLNPAVVERLKPLVNLLVAIPCCYFAISLVLQTKDDFRFIIPYVEFSKQTKGARPILLDTSVLIDGRIGDISETGVLESQLIVPRFVLEELQQVADSADKLKRNRGRRGLDVLQRLQDSPRVDVVLFETADTNTDDKDAGVDAMLVNLAKDLGGRILTNDFNLNKVAQLRGVDVININDLANALKPVVLPGETMTVRIIKPGDQPGQGVGYLEDGTMVVVEQGRPHLNEEVSFTVTSALQTSAGKMIFGRLGEAPALRSGRAQRVVEPEPSTPAKSARP
jgi:uncharacterized protein YacL